MPEEDDTPTRRSEYRSRASGMRNALFLIGFVGYILLSRVWATYGYYNTWYYLGGWGLFLVFVMFLYGPLVVANRSPKFSSDKIGGTIASPQPIAECSAQAGWPKMVLYDPGSVKGLGIYEHTMTAKAYVWLPKSLAYIVGEEDRGVNVVANCHLTQLSEHCELPPHLLNRMVKMKRPAYKPEMPCFVGLYPLMINKLAPEKIEEYQKRCEHFGISHKAFEDGVTEDQVPFRQILDQYASETSKFEFDEEFTKAKEAYEVRTRALSTENAKLQAQLEWWQSYATTQNRIFNPQTPVPVPTTFQKITSYGQNNQTQEQDQNAR